MVRNIGYICGIVRWGVLGVLSKWPKSPYLSLFGMDDNNIKEAFISPEIPVIEVRKSWFAESETSPNGSPTVRVALQEPKTVTQLRFFKLW